MDNDTLTAFSVPELLRFAAAAIEEVSELKRELSVSKLDGPIHALKRIREHILYADENEQESVSIDDLDKILFSMEPKWMDVITEAANE